MASGAEEPLTYSAAGVDTDAASAGLAGMLSWVRETLEFRKGMGEPLLPIGFFANVLRLTDQLSVAISTDGVGSKVLVAQLMERYDTIGIDCVAVNVNDVICTGAEPVALLDYIGVQEPRRELLEDIGRGLHEGARQARVAIVGGELSQGHAFDLVGMALGVLQGREPIVGKNIQPGDVVIGLPSNGVHSNGLTLARRVLLREGDAGVARQLPECGRTVGEELLRPTRIYVQEVMALLDAGVDVKGLAHISGDGLLNLTRLAAPVGYRITSLPPPPSIFPVVQSEGSVSTAEMFRVFNMGVGFCVVVAPQEVDAALAVIGSAGGAAVPIGHAVDDAERRVVIEPHGLVGRNGRFLEGEHAL